MLVQSYTGTSGCYNSREYLITCDTYQVKELKDFLSTLQLLPLDDELGPHSRIFVTGDLLVDLHELQKATALGIKCCNLVVGRPVLWTTHPGQVWFFFVRVFRLCLLTVTGSKVKFAPTFSPPTLNPKPTWRFIVETYMGHHDGYDESFYSWILIVKFVKNKHLHRITINNQNNSHQPADSQCPPIETCPEKTTPCLSCQ